jgi:SAM-dependent methyltransferase
LSLPLPPIEYRRLIGLPDPKDFENPEHPPVLPENAGTPRGFVLDFGSGCGRVARHLIRERPQPLRYLGIDRHKPMVDWCRANLMQHAPGFDFQHHDVFHPHLNPGGTPGPLRFPVADEEITLLIGVSIFTHLLEEDAAFYLREVGRVLSPSGLAMTTWFLFDKQDFPMMQEFQNALMINPADLTNAVIFDREWLVKEAAAADLVITRVVPPRIRGFHWMIYFERRAAQRTGAAFPADLAPRGIERPPLS